MKEVKCHVSITMSRNVMVEVPEDANVEDHEVLANAVTEQIYTPIDDPEFNLWDIDDFTVL